MVQILGAREGPLVRGHQNQKGNNTPKITALILPLDVLSDVIIDRCSSPQICTYPTILCFLRRDMGKKFDWRWFVWLSKVERDNLPLLHEPRDVPLSPSNKEELLPETFLQSRVFLRARSISVFFGQGPRIKAASLSSVTLDFYNIWWVGGWAHKFQYLVEANRVITRIKHLERMNISRIGISRRE